ncbi:MAG TPA: hypothetical protein PKJ56_05655 [Promineifilum sp.]|nr:hypothetical protein [Promineifilum sp.]
MYSDSTRTTDDHRARANILRYIQALAVALVAMWLYRRALGFAYFNDDPTGHFAWMEGRSLLQFFTSSAEYGYYRPVVFAVLRLSEILFGNASFPHNPVADHALLWLLHGGNVALTWLLARRLSDSAAFAWATALIFASVPFNYEAVAYVASLTHPLLLFWLLVALLSFMDGRRVAAMLALILGLLTHENGLFILPALVGVDWMMRPHSPVSERARRLWPFAVPPLLFVVLWLAIPKNSDQGLNSLTDIARNTAPFLQTLIYPLLPALRFESSDTVWLALAAVTMMAMTGLLVWRMRTLRVWAYALMWFALSIVPALLFLGPTSTAARAWAICRPSAWRCYGRCLFCGSDDGLLSARLAFMKVSRMAWGVAFALSSPGWWGGCFSSLLLCRRGPSSVASLTFTMRRADSRAGWLMPQAMPRRSAGWCSSTRRSSSALPLPDPAAVRRPIRGRRWGPSSFPPMPRHGILCALTEDRTAMSWESPMPVMVPAGELLARRSTAVFYEALRLVRQPMYSI